MTIYILTKTRISTDLYDQCEDGCKVVGAYANLARAQNALDIELAALAAHYAATAYNGEEERPDKRNALYIVSGKDGALEHVYTLAIHEKVVQG